LLKVRTVRLPVAIVTLPVQRAIITKWLGCLPLVGWAYLAGGPTGPPGNGGWGQGLFARERRALLG